MIQFASGTTGQPIYISHGLPVFQNCTYLSREEAKQCARGNVTLVQDLNTGLVFNETFDPELVKYGPEYQNEQALSTVFQSHLGAVTEVVDRHFRGLSLIEVGCGKGYFLERLISRGFDVVGMDPAYEGSNPRIVKEYFSPTSGRRADGILLRHVLEHICDPLSFLRLIREANGGQGKIYIEVPCFDWICTHRAWFDVFYEHANYFRLDDLCRMFGKIYETGRLFGDQYIYIVADLRSLIPPRANAWDAVAFPSDFLLPVESQATLVRATSGRGTAIWGASSKGVIFALMMERAGAAIDLAIDINPAKQGRYLPVTGLKVSSPEEAMSSLPSTATILVMNGNYLKEIRSTTQNRYRFRCIDGAPV